MSRPRSTMMVARRRLCGWIVLAMGAACNPDAPMDALVEAPAEAAGGKDVPAGAAATQTAAAPPSRYVYSAAGHRDPFRSFLLDLQERRNEERDHRRREETEAFDTSQYRLTGIVTGHRQSRAMVEDPVGKGYMLKVGSRIGKNGGRITNIDATGMSIVEEFLDGTGKVVRLPSVVRLPANEDIRPREP